MKIDKDRLFARIVADAAAGFDGNEGAVGGAVGATPEQRKFVADNAQAMLGLVLAIHLAPPGTVTCLSEAGKAEVRRIVDEALAAGIDIIAVSEA